ncbi:MAG: hypothetical protein ACSHX7_03685 [Luteolibacter sp.]
MAADQGRRISEKLRMRTAAVRKPAARGHEKSQRSGEGGWL